jgi:hypothetical protein
MEEGPTLPEAELARRCLGWERYLNCDRFGSALCTDCGERDGRRQLCIDIVTTHSFNTANIDTLSMDARVKKAVLAKLDEAISGRDEIAKIQQSLEHIHVGSQDDFAFGIAIGRIYNSFHYQTRRTLKRNATEGEFAEFLDILAKKAGEIRNALEQQ